MDVQSVSISVGLMLPRDSEAFDVVEVVDVIGHPGGQFDPRCSSAGIGHLDAHPRPEQFHGGAIEAVAQSPERAKQVERRMFSPTPGRKLRVVIGIQDLLGHFEFCCRQPC